MKHKYVSPIGFKVQNRKSPNYIPFDLDEWPDTAQIVHVKNDEGEVIADVLIIDNDAHNQFVEGLMELKG